MSLNDTASANRAHIAFFGMRNAGKSSLVNAVTGQELSVVSNVPGTTTDPVKKAMELLPLGPVVIIDTPGYDDVGELGEKRIKKTNEILYKTHIAVLVVDATSGIRKPDLEMIDVFEKRNIPYLVVLNKSDLVQTVEELPENHLFVSAITNDGVEDLKNKLGEFFKKMINKKHIVADLLVNGDVVVLVTPIDQSAPKGRLILPQQQTIRDILDAGCISIVCKETELEKTLKSLSVKPKMIITDSQVFGQVEKQIPDDVMLTSFSILFARYKGDLKELVKGAKRLSELKPDMEVLISEGCTHHRQCNDIGTVKLPGWIEKYTGFKPKFSFTSGGQFPDDLSKYSLVIHCGGCMLNDIEMQNRVEKAKQAGVPIVNYGVAIAQMHGILTRSLSPFKDEL